MTSNAEHRDYDENLLASAPVATKAQLQSGYNPDLLVEKTTPPPRPRRNLEAGDTSPIEQADHEPMPPKVPFYRTKKGMIIIAVVAIVVIIAAAVGGGVGSKAGRKQSTIAQPGSSNQTTSTTTPMSTEVGNPGGVPDTATATTPRTGQTTIGPGATSNALSGLTGGLTSTHTSAPAQPAGPGNGT